MDDEKTFALAEYSALRAEILLRISASQALERNALISAALIGGFLLVHQPHGWERGAWALPFLIAVFGCLRTACDERVFRQLGSYVQQIEDTYHSEASKEGWEWYRQDLPARLFGRRVDLVWRNAFWGAFLAVTLAAAVCGVWF
jgi:hypothetical protein